MTALLLIQHQGGAASFTPTHQDHVGVTRLTCGGINQTVRGFHLIILSVNNNTKQESAGLISHRSIDNIPLMCKRIFISLF